MNGVKDLVVVQENPFLIFLECRNEIPIGPCHSTPIPSFLSIRFSPYGRFLPAPRRAPQHALFDAESTSVKQALIMRLYKVLQKLPEDRQGVALPGWLAKVLTSF